MPAISPEPLFSVIIPVYRAETFLARCVDSLLKQEHRNIDIILVDDGSPDNSGVLCDDYATRDKRIRVIHQANAGPGAARNAGLATAAGDFICFVDADDYVAPGYISHFVRGMGDEVDLVFQGICEIHDGVETRKIPQPKLYSRHELCEAIADINKQSMFGYVCNKCYRRSIIEQHHLRFRTDINLSEDRLFALEYMLHIRKMQITDGCCYFYEMQNTGLTNKVRPYHELKAAADANLHAALRLLEQSPSERFFRDTRRMYVMCAVGFLNVLFRNGSSYKDLADAIQQFRQTAGTWLGLYHPGTTDRAMLCLALRLPLFLCIPLMQTYWFIKKKKHEISA